ncbi:MAG: hypothetical protein AMS20_00190 [Gemmatimonas sp. SG8_28]|nr:MAG: hypothetical protein AMS20_00190 [Gemmatimonas sp. SG8_28]
MQTQGVIRNTALDGTTHIRVRVDLSEGGQIQGGHVDLLFLKEDWQQLAQALDICCGSLVNVTLALA